MLIQNVYNLWSLRCLLSTVCKLLVQINMYTLCKGIRSLKDLKFLIVYCGMCQIRVYNGFCFYTLVVNSQVHYSPSPTNKPCTAELE